MITDRDELKITQCDSCVNCKLLTVGHKRADGKTMMKPVDFYYNLECNKKMIFIRTNKKSKCKNYEKRTSKVKVQSNGVDKI